MPPIAMATPTYSTASDSVQPNSSCTRGWPILLMYAIGLSFVKKVYFLYLRLDKDEIELVDEVADD